MPAEIINGEAVIWGVQNTGQRISLTGYATFRVNKLGGKHTFNITDLTDEIGFDTTTVAANEHFEITMDFTPTGATRAAAHAIPSVPIPLAKITLANCKVQTAFGSSVGKLFDGDYQYRGGVDINLQEAAVGKITGMILRKYADVVQNSSLTTTVVG